MQKHVGLQAQRRILVTGGTGQVGYELVRVLAPLGEIIAPGRTQMDMADPKSIREMIRSVQPRWVVNPAAYTAVDRAESEPDLAYAINAEAVRVIGEEACSIGAGVIHFSTDYVFDGAGSTPYVETDPTMPVSVYGASKLAGERALADSGAAHIIFRTSWVYGARGRNFLLTILRLAREKDRLRVVADQYGAPTWSRDLARMVAHVIEMCDSAESDNEDHPAELPARLCGVYHAAGNGETTWYGFAMEAIRLQKERRPAERFAEVEAVATEEYPTAARRPANSRLNCQKLKLKLQWQMMDWRESLQNVSAEI